MRVQARTKQPNKVAFCFGHATIDKTVALGDRFESGKRHSKNARETKRDWLSGAYARERKRVAVVQYPKKLK